MKSRFLKTILAGGILIGIVFFAVGFTQFGTDCDTQGAQFRELLLPQEYALRGVRESYPGPVRRSDQGQGRERHIVLHSFLLIRDIIKIYNLPPGLIDVALQDGFDSTTPSVDLKAGETKTADVALKVRPDKLRAGTGRLRHPCIPRPNRDYS